MACGGRSSSFTNDNYGVSVTDEEAQTRILLQSLWRIRKLAQATSVVCSQSMALLAFAGWSQTSSICGTFIRSCNHRDERQTWAINSAVQSFANDINLMVLASAMQEFRGLSFASSVQCMTLFYHGQRGVLQAEIYGWLLEIMSRTVIRGIRHHFGRITIEARCEYQLWGAGMDYEKWSAN